MSSLFASLPPLPLFITLLLNVSALLSTTAELSARPLNERGATQQLRLEGRVTLEPAQAADRWASLRLPATVGTSPRAHWDLAPHTDGHLVTWLVHLGDQVEEGAPLAKIAPYQVIDLKARVSSLSSISQARGKLYRALERQVRSGALPRARLDEAEASWEEAKAELKEARAALKARSRHAAHPTTWHSPMRGVVTDLKCAPGAHLDAGAACLTLSDISQTSLEVRAPYAELSRFEVGARAQWRALNSRALSDEGSQGQLELTLSLLIPPQTRGDVMGRAIFAPVEGVELPSAGVVGELEVLSEAPEGAVVVPRAALVEWGGQARLFVESQGHLAPLNVERLGALNGQVVVRGAGLEVGSLVAVRGAFLLKSRALLSED